MDVNDIVNALNGILDLGDTLDNAGIGIKSASNGEHTTRDIIKLELGFLSYAEGVKNTYFMNPSFDTGENETSFSAQGPYGKFDELNDVEVFRVS